MDVCYTRAMDFEDDDFIEFFHMHGSSKECIQELCIQIGQLQNKLLDYERVKERIYELEMRVGMHANDYRQFDLF